MAEPIDIHTTAGKLAELRTRLDEAVHAGSVRAVEMQHAKGKLTARERIDLLLDEGSFQELDELARHRSTSFGIEQNRPYTDGVVTGYGTVDGRTVCVFARYIAVTPSRSSWANQERTRAGLRSLSATPPR